MGRDISNEGFLLWHGAKLREKLTFFMRWQENVLDGQAMDWFPCLPTRKKYLFMGFSKSTLFFISKILYLSYCKIDNQTSLKKLIKQTAYGNKIYIGMGAGSISNWMKNLY